MLYRRIVAVYSEKHTEHTKRSHDVIIRMDQRRLPTKAQKQRMILDTIPSQMNPAHILTSYYIELHFNIILRNLSRYPVRFFVLSFSD
jgi:hypothetical protein